MAKEFTMPKLGHLMEEGTIVRWIKQVGDTVERGDILLEIEMDKAIVQVEALFDGVLLSILVEPGQTVPVGTPLALYGQAGEHV